MNMEFKLQTNSERSDAADQLNSQAQACRRLAEVARSKSGAEALLAVAREFEAAALSTSHNEAQDRSS